MFTITFLFTKTTNVVKNQNKLIKWATNKCMFLLKSVFFLRKIVTKK